jgi:hypothetical protein
MYGLRNPVVKDSPCVHSGYLDRDLNVSALDGGYMAKLKRVVGVGVALLLLFVPFNWRVRADVPALGIDGTHFTVDSTQKFLVFVSYFDAVDAGMKVDRDFSQLKALGVDGVRIFPNWWTKSSINGNVDSHAGDTIIDSDGNIRETPWGLLVEIIEEAAEHGLLVDLTFTADTVGNEDPSCEGAELGYNDYKSALEEITDRLSGANYEHVLFDLQNESNITGPLCGSLSNAQALDLVSAVHGVDSSRIVTVSVQSDINSNGSAAPAGTRAAYSGQDVVAYHEDRGNGSDNWYDAYDDIVDDIHSEASIPVYLQEPAKMYSTSHDADDFLAAVGAAYSAGAAAWTFHSNAGSFMNDPGNDYLDNLMDEERKFLSLFRAGGVSGLGEVDDLYVSLETIYEYFFGYSGSQAVATAESPGSVETFVIHNHSHGGAALFDGDQISFLLYNGYHYQAEDGGNDDGKTLLADSSNEYAWETFTIHSVSRCSYPTLCYKAILNGDQIALETSEGRFVSAQGGGNDVIDADRTAIGDWEKFWLRLFNQ